MEKKKKYQRGSPGKQRPPLTMKQWHARRATLVAFKEKKILKMQIWRRSSFPSFMLSSLRNFTSIYSYIHDAEYNPYYAFYRDIKCYYSHTWMTNAASS